MSAHFFHHCNAVEEELVLGVDVCFALEDVCGQCEYDVDPSTEVIFEGVVHCDHFLVAGVAEDIKQEDGAVNYS